jgi:hypothetical protein
MSNTSSPIASTPAPKVWRKRLLIVAALLLAVLSIVVWWRYFKAYSEGERIGKDLKISTRGNVFKTCEGYFTEGCRDVVGTSTFFYFSVADELVEEKLKQLQLEPNACIQVTYRETNNTLPWRGESVYLITDAKRLDAE